MNLNRDAHFSSLFLISFPPPLFFAEHFFLHYVYRIYLLFSFFHSAVGDCGIFADVMVGNMNYFQEYFNSWKSRESYALIRLIEILGQTFDLWDTEHPEDMLFKRFPLSIWPLHYHFLTLN